MDKAYMKNMDSIIQKIRSFGIVPVVKIDDTQKAVPLAQALRDGGLLCIEITFRTAQAEDAIRQIAAQFPDMLVGAGTVLTAQQADCAAAAGAKFVVTPGLNPIVVDHCIARKIPVIPGCAIPSDIEKALEFGLTAVKFFPAEAMGGIKTIKAVSAPYSNIQFMPTGGINKANLRDYLAFSAVIACGGSWIADSLLMGVGDFEKITNLASEAMAIVRQCRKG